MEQEPNNLNLSLTAKELRDLDELCCSAIGLGSPLGWNTYVIKKLLYSLIRRLPRERTVTFTTEKRFDREADGYVFFDVEDITQKNEGEEK